MKIKKLYLKQDCQPIWLKGSMAYPKAKNKQITSRIQINIYNTEETIWPYCYKLVEKSLYIDIWLLNWKYLIRPNRATNKSLTKHNKFRIMSYLNLMVCYQTIDLKPYNGTL